MYFCPGQIKTVRLHTALCTREIRVSGSMSPVAVNSKENGLEISLRTRTSRKTSAGKPDLTNANGRRCLLNEASLQHNVSQCDTPCYAPTHTHSVILGVLLEWKNIQKKSRTPSGWSLVRFNGEHRKERFPETLSGRMSHVACRIHARVLQMVFISQWTVSLYYTNKSKTADR